MKDISLSFHKMEKSTVTIKKKNKVKQDIPRHCSLPFPRATAHTPIHLQNLSKQDLIFSHFVIYIPFLALNSLLPFKTWYEGKLVFGTQSTIYVRTFCEIVNVFQPITIFLKSAIKEGWLGSRFASGIGIMKLLLLFPGLKGHSIFLRKPFDQII